MGTSAPWKVQGEEKRAAVRQMFAEVAPTYDLVNSLMCLGLHRKWRREAVRAIGLSKGDSAIDVCSGTGDFLVPLSAAVGSAGRVVGVDFCLPMLTKASDKLEGPLLSVGDAGRLPVRSNSFDGLTVGWGLRNVPDVSAALFEAARVLCPGGRMVSLDMARPRSAFVGRISEWVFHRVVPFIGRVFGKSEAYTYLPKSTLQFLSREEMKAAMERAGFQKVQWRDYFFGNVCMHWGIKS